MDTVTAPVLTTVLTEYCARLPNLRDLAQSPDALATQCSLVRMEDDAMVGAGMPCGSATLVMIQQEFSSGDIVLVHTPHGNLIRRFVTQDRPPYLSLRPDPEDAFYRTIPFGPDSKLLGRVIGMVQSDGSVHAIANVNR